MPNNIKGLSKVIGPYEVQRIIELNAHISDFQSQLQDMLDTEKKQGNRWQVVHNRLLERIESIREMLGTLEALLRSGTGDLSKDQINSYNQATDIILL